MTRVFKYKLSVRGDANIEAVVKRWLAVGWQGDSPVVWAEVDDDYNYRQNILKTIFTGDEVPFSYSRHVSGGEYVERRWKFLGTTQSPDGLVVHVYVYDPFTTPEDE